jgi:hypothetical protein
MCSLESAYNCGASRTENSTSEVHFITCLQIGSPRKS